MTTQPGGTGRLARLFEAADRRRVPLRTILVTVGVVVATYLAGKLLYRLRDIVLLMLVAGSGQRRQALQVVGGACLVSGLGRQGQPLLQVSRRAGQVALSLAAERQVVQRGEGKDPVLCTARCSGQTRRSPAIHDGVSEGTRTPDTQDHNGVVKLQPFLGVDEVFLARVLAELFLKGCDDPADVVLGAFVGSRHEDHAVVSCAAGQHGLDV
jgi:hypothetical protein